MLDFARGSYQELINRNFANLSSLSCGSGGSRPVDNRGGRGRGLGPPLDPPLYEQVPSDILPIRKTEEKRKKLGIRWIM